MFVGFCALSLKSSDVRFHYYIYCLFPREAPHFFMGAITVFTKVSRSKWGGTLINPTLLTPYFKTCLVSLLFLLVAAVRTLPSAAFAKPLHSLAGLNGRRAVRSRTKESGRPPSIPRTDSFFPPSESVCHRYCSWHY